MDLQTLTTNFIQEEIDALEYQLSEIANYLDSPWNRMSDTTELDLLYATSVGFLVVITMLITAALFSFHEEKLPKYMTNQKAVARLTSTNRSIENSPTMALLGFV